jgi:predicted dinucleotide-binding enzyme
MNGKPTIAILGGTGDLGSGLAKCWLAAGYKVILGSRVAEKAKNVADAMTGAVAGPLRPRGRRGPQRLERAALLSSGATIRVISSNGEF